MSLSLRGLLIALPIVALFVGAMAFITYQSAITDYRTDAASELANSNQAAVQSLRREIVLVSGVQSRAARHLLRKMKEGPAEAFDQVFTEAEDGAFHTRPELWTGKTFGGSIRVEGIGGFSAPPRPAGQREDTLLAAFATLRDMASGLPGEIESLYFFSPDNDLIIFAPQRQDQLEFYRQAPADFDFQASEFSKITSLAANPVGEMRCTSLQRPAYDPSGENWTTGCMLPVRSEGDHLGAWGVSIPLERLTSSLREPSQGALTVIASSDGKLVYRSGLGRPGAAGAVSNTDLADSSDPMLRSLAAYLKSGPGSSVAYDDRLQAYVATERLETPDWFVVTVLPEEALTFRAFAIATRVILVAVVGALLLGLLLTAIFHRTVGLRISNLVSRTDRIAPVDAERSWAGEGDEIRQLEAAFEEMEERLRLASSRERRSFDILVDAAKGYAMAIFDPQGGVVRANEGALELFGAEGLDQFGELIGGSVAGDGNDQSSPIPGPIPASSERILPGGRTAWLEEMVVPLEDENGSVYALAYIGHDLTEYRKAQREIERNLLYLELAQSSADAGHFSLDPDTMEVTLSDWLAKRLGRTSATMPLASVADLIDESERSQTMDRIAQAIADKSEFSFESIVIGNDQERFPVVVRGSAVFEESADEPSLAGFYGIVQDITDQREAAQALMRARDEARAEAQARADILAVIAHEIRTPISGILGLIDHIRRERSETEKKRALSLIAHSSEALLKTLDATLQRTRAEREDHAGQREEFEPASLLERVAGLFRPLARRKGLALDVLAADHHRVIGEPARIQQIIANFVSNAIMFTQTGSVTLSILAPENDGDAWRFLVEDTGSGIDPERMKTIFEPFGGTATDTLGRSGGSGLGLSITRELAEQIGGTVTAERADGGGTRMVLTLPLEKAADMAGDKAPRGEIAVRIGKASLAVRVEALAHIKGFVLADPSTNEGLHGTPSVLVTDEPAASSDDRFTKVFRLAQGGAQGGDGHLRNLSDEGLIAQLAAFFDEVGDG